MHFSLLQIWFCIAIVVGNHRKISEIDLLTIEFKLIRIYRTYWVLRHTQHSSFERFSVLCFLYDEPMTYYFPIDQKSICEWCKRPVYVYLTIKLLVKYTFSECIASGAPAFFLMYTGFVYLEKRIKWCITLLVLYYYMCR